MDKTIISDSNTPGIMIVDDEIMFAEFLGELLHNHGYTSSIFNCSMEALKNFVRRPNQYRLVISDLLMPKLTGNHLAEKMLAINPDISILLCSGYTANIDLSEIKNHDRIHILDKPLNQTKLFEIIEGT
ncbi:MAG: response regulator [Gammaproteobacteria bacterium]|nr:response regulator [Gammaproteobacteria bacterium]